MYVVGGWLWLLLALASGGRLGADASRILLVSPQSGSHLMELQHLGRTLVERGHEVYIALHDLFPASYARPPLRTLTYHVTNRQTLRWSSPQVAKLLVTDAFARDPFFTFVCPHCEDYTLVECASMLHDKAFMARVGALKFDLAIVDSIIFSACNFLLPHHFGIPHVYFSHSLGRRAREPALPSFCTSFYTRYSHRMTFYERLVNTLLSVIYDIGNDLPYMDHSLLREFAPDVGSWNELVRRSVLYIVPDDYVAGWPRPSLPNVIRLGTMSLAPAAALTDDFEREYAAAKHGVVLVSFGSFDGFMPPDVVKKMIAAFARLRETVVWKVTAPDSQIYRHLPANIRTFSWIPQADLLADSRTKLFVTHCGNCGYNEAIYHGVPMVGFPLFADQPHNAHRLYDHGLGLLMRPNHFTSDQLYDTINEVLNNGSYAAAVAKASAIVKDRPMLPRDTAAYWVEHVMKFGGEHLRSYAQDMPWYQFYMVDIFLFVATLVLAALYVVRLVVMVVWSRCFANSKVKQQ